MIKTTALITLATALLLPSAWAQTAAPAPAPEVPQTLCGAEGCRRGNDLLLQVHGARRRARGRTGWAVRDRAA